MFMSESHRDSTFSLALRPAGTAHVRRERGIPVTGSTEGLRNGAVMHGREEASRLHYLGVLGVVHYSYPIFCIVHAMVFDALLMSENSAYH